MPRPPRKARSDGPRQSPTRDTSARVALLAAEAGLDKKASAIEIIDVSGKVDYADFLVLMTGSSDRHVAAIADSVEDLLGRNGIQSHSMEGRTIASWVLIDFVDIVVHVFQKEARAVYDLDGLWMDASRLPMPSIPDADS
ncbi:MAG TPA: ribosome silencing factor [Polyangiaceae bacterium]|jgi:ribosome-associated protein|nr:ribosome silencing factor [Polyangiaceae bacterium]